MAAQYTQGWNAENKLAGVTWSDGSGSFTYDGDGERLIKTEDGVTAVYIGKIFEKTGNTETQYYYFGGERVAMRRGSDVKYVHSDHLGSANLTTDVAVLRLVREMFTGVAGE